MKKKIHVIGLLAMFTVFYLPAEASIWRVNNLSDYNGSNLYGGNFGGTSLNPVFKQPSQAVGSGLVLPGDTLHLEGSPDSYLPVVLTKRLVIIGPGYFLPDNPKTSLNMFLAAISRITYNAGSEGSQLIGVVINTSNGIDINTDNILVKRCRFTNHGNIALASLVKDIIITGNFFESLSNADNAVNINNNGAPFNVVINNNIFLQTLILVNGTQTANLTECKNNVFDCPALASNPSLRFNCSSFENNILKTVGATVNINNNSNQNVSYNFSASSSGQFGTANGNQVVDMAATFVDQTTVTPDNKYQLKPGSVPGADGTERGAFGGAAITNRYTLSGLAPVPVIYQVTTSGVATATGLPVTIRARTIN